MTLAEQFKGMFTPVCVNRYRSWKFDDTKGSGKTKIPFPYGNDDFKRWAKEAFEKGEDYFYADVINPGEEHNLWMLCEPRYSYKAEQWLTEESYNTFVTALERLEGKTVSLPGTPPYSAKDGV